ncbi:hypothetical protein D9M68_946520 [compost metagenome]
MQSRAMVTEKVASISVRAVAMDFSPSCLAVSAAVTAIFSSFSSGSPVAWIDVTQGGV